jgi:hypothetical protein
MIERKRFVKEIKIFIMSSYLIISLYHFYFDNKKDKAIFSYFLLAQA